MRAMWKDADCIETNAGKKLFKRQDLKDPQMRRISLCEGKWERRMKRTDEAKGDSEMKRIQKLIQENLKNYPTDKLSQEYYE